MQSRTKKMRILTVSLAAGLTLGLVGTAAAVAATNKAPAPPYVACSATNHVLSVEVHGKCPAGTVLVTIGAKGATGAKGKYPEGNNMAVVHLGARPVRV
jgi:hypothetical protein